MRVPFYGGGEIILFSHSSIPRGTPDAEYDLRFDADEEYVRELIDRIDEMSFREVKLCSRCTAKHAGKWQAKPGRAQCAECEQNVERHFILQKAATVARRTSRGIG